MAEQDPGQPTNVKNKEVRTIKVSELARVEGEGALFVDIEGDKVKDVKLKIFEPPRFFEAFLRGRDWKEVSDITARICGICPVAYQISAVNALEDLAGKVASEPIQQLRRLLYCGEWIESHTLHMYMLHAPDFLKYPDCITMAKDFPKVVENGLKLKKAGNRILQVLGGREIHPINVKLGGFYHLPEKKQFLELRKELVEAESIARECLDWVSRFHFPEAERDYEYVAMHHPDEYAITRGRIQSNKGIDIEPSEYNDIFEEEHVEHSNALHAKIKSRGSYLTGPMARLQLNFDQLPNELQKLAENHAVIGTKNPFKSIIVRSIEVIYACMESIRVIDQIDWNGPIDTDILPKKAEGHGCSEAPRGLLYHRYQTDAEGLVELAQIVPPTSQNQKSIEEDLQHIVPLNFSKTQEELTHLCEQAIRNYDPCISCATHFLKLEVRHT